MPSLSYILEFDVFDSVAVCTEPGRVTRVHVSGYDRRRVHVANLYANERRCLVANFKSVIGSATITSVTWNTLSGASIHMSAGSISGKEVRVTIAAQYAGVSIIRCTVTLSNGERYPQNIRVNVLSQPYYPDDVYTDGPTTLTVTA